jgi:hypothetical protein
VHDAYPAVIATQFYVPRRRFLERIVSKIAENNEQAVKVNVTASTAILFVDIFQDMVLQKLLRSLLSYTPYLPPATAYRRFRYRRRLRSGKTKQRDVRHDQKTLLGRDCLLLGGAGST